MSIILQSSSLTSQLDRLLGFLLLDSSYSADKSPSAAGLQTILVTVDGCPLADVYKVILLHFQVLFTGVN